MDSGRAGRALPAAVLGAKVLQVDTPKDSEACSPDEELTQAWLTIDGAVEAAFGSTGPSQGLLIGAALIGVPSYQRRVLLVCGLVKASLALSLFLPLFTHEEYNPDCNAPKSSWMRPRREGLEHESVAFEWMLCCGEEWLLAQAGSVYFMGNAVGAASGGILADNFGRRPVMLLASLLHGAAVLLMSISPNIEVYIIARFLAGAACMAIMTSTYTFAVEWIPGRWRTCLSAFLFSCTAVGELCLVVLAKATLENVSASWRALTAIIGWFLLAVVLVEWIALPESPRWLHANGHEGEAAELLCKVMHRNAEALGPAATGSSFTKVAATLSKVGICPGVTTPKAQDSKDASAHAGRGAVDEALRKVSTWAMALTWLAASMGYYGVSLAGDVLSQGLDLYSSAALSGLLEAPSGFLAAFLLDRPRLGRRLSTSLLLGLGACCLVILPAVPGERASSLALLAKFFISAAFDGLYVFASEVFDTAVRGAAMGFCSTAARLGSMSAPQALTLMSSESSAMRAFGLSCGAASVVCHCLLPETSAPAFHSSTKASEDDTVVELSTSTISRRQRDRIDSN